MQLCTKAHHQDVPRYLSVMDVLCAPSQTSRNTRERFGRMLIEAFAAEVLVIGSDSGEIPNVIADAGIVCGEKGHHGWVRELRAQTISGNRTFERNRKLPEDIKQAEYIGEDRLEHYRIGSAFVRDCWGLDVILDKECFSDGLVNVPAQPNP